MANFLLLDTLLQFTFTCTFDTFVHLLPQMYFYNQIIQASFIQVLSVWVTFILTEAILKHVFTFSPRLVYFLQG